MATIIASPEALATFLKVQEEPNAESNPKDITIKLLQPLTHKQVFEANRDPKLRVTDRNHIPADVRACEELDISISLGKEWRKVWAQIRPQYLRKVTFDLAIDLSEVPDAGQRVPWDTKLIEVRDERNIEVRLLERSVMTLVSGMATILHMKSKGSVQMEVVPFAEDYAPGRMFRKVQENLRMLRGEPRKDY